MAKEKDTTQQPIYVERIPAALEFRPYTLVHPALDFKKETAYVGIALPERVRGKTVHHPYFVTETEIFGMTDEELGKRNIELVHKDLPSDISRWSIEGIKRFLNGKEDINPEKLYNSIMQAIHEYIDFQDQRYYDLVALWNIGTYFHQLFESYPYLHVNGLTDTGKTQLLKVCQCIAFNAEHYGDLTAATFFRKINASRCTLLLDENEELADPVRSQVLRKLLLNGYKKGPKVSRSDMANLNYPSRDYEVYSPKILASITALDNVLGSRCVSVLMQPTSKKEVDGKAIRQDNPNWQTIRDMAYPFLFRKWRTIQQSYDELRNETDLANRHLELWQPILALARVFNRDIYKEMLQLALEKAEERKSEQGFTPEAELAEALLSIVDRDDFYRLKIIKEYIEEEYRYKAPSWITEKYIGSMLRKFGFPRPKRDSKGFKYYLTVSQVAEIAKRLGIDDERSAHSVGPTEGQ
jgi:hypothetical protein